MKNQLITVMTLILPFVLQSCSVYSSSFSCSDSKGAPCVMLSDVNRMIDSGEIKTVYQNKKCRTGKCALENENVPKVKK
jgi:hypothetical protein